MSIKTASLDSPPPSLNLFGTRTRTYDATFDKAYIMSPLHAYSEPTQGMHDMRPLASGAMVSVLVGLQGPGHVASRWLGPVKMKMDAHESPLRWQMLEF